jgi:hypothetical protein
LQGLSRTNKGRFEGATKPIILQEFLPLLKIKLRLACVFRCRWLTATTSNNYLENPKNLTLGF